MNVSEQDWSAGYRRGYDDAKRDYVTVVEASPAPEVQPAPGDSIPWTTTTISPNALELVVVRLDNLAKWVASLDDWLHHAVSQDPGSATRRWTLRLGDAGLDPKVPVGLALDELFRRVIELEKRVASLDDWSRDRQDGHSSPHGNFSSSSIH